jgi:hypothetical protein
MKETDKYTKRRLTTEPGRSKEPSLGLKDTLSNAGDHQAIYDIYVMRLQWVAASYLDVSRAAEGILQGP